MKTSSRLALGLLILCFSLSFGLMAQCPPQVTVLGNTMVFDYHPGAAPNDSPTIVTTSNGTKYQWEFTFTTTINYKLIPNTGPVFSLPGSFNYSGNICVFDALGGIDDFFLPIELSQFTVNLVGKDVQVFWQTTSEENNAGFELQRSFNGEDFEVISALPGMGTTSTAQSYHFLDRDVKAIALANTVYYRLKHSDWDGTFYYSEIVSLDLNIQIKNFGFSKITVKDQSQVQIFYQTPDTKAAIVSMTDLHGRVIFYQKLKPTKGFNQVKFDLLNELKGMYIIHLTNGVEMVNKKLFLLGN